jgi:hypothetical protein
MYFKLQSIYKKCVGMFPFKSETEPINTKSVVIRYQVLLAAYYKNDTEYCCCNATCLSGHIVDFTTHTHTHINRLYTIRSIVGGLSQSVLNLIRRVKVFRCAKMAETCEWTLRYRRTWFLKLWYAYHHWYANHC